MTTPTTIITYTGFNEVMERTIREYMSECENITSELDSGFFMEEGADEGTRDITFEGVMTVGEEMELEDIGQQYNLTILTEGE